MLRLICTIICSLSFMSAFAQTGGQREFMTIQEAMSIVSYRRYHPMMDEAEFERFLKPTIKRYGYREGGFLEGIGTCMFWQYYKGGNIIYDNVPDNYFVPNNKRLASTVAVVDCCGIETIENDETSISVELSVFSEENRDMLMKEMIAKGFKYRKTEDWFKQYVWQSYIISITELSTRDHKYWKFEVSLEPRDYGTTKTVEFDDSTKSHHVTVVMDYPVRGNPAMLRRVRSYIMETLEWGLVNDEPIAHYTGDPSDGQALADYYGRKTVALKKERYDDVLMPLMESTSISKVAENDHYISFEVFISGCYGGPHAIYRVLGATFRKSDGKRLHVIANSRNPQFRHFLNTQLYIESETVKDEYKGNVPMPKYEPYLIQSGVRFAYQQHELSDIEFVKADASFPEIKNYLTDEVKEVLK